MKRILMAMVPVALFTLGSPAFAADQAAKPDCSEKQKALDDANTAAKTAATPDLSSCKDKKGKDKTDCEKPLKGKVKDAKTALDCCKNPKKKGCSS